MKLPRNIPGKEVHAILVKHYGWKVHLRVGSHVTLKKKEEREILTVPLHDELKAGTLLGILRKAGIEKEDFRSKI